MERRQFIRCCSSVLAACALWPAAGTIAYAAERRLPGMSLPRGARRRIVIDPGHGGQDPGAIGHGGVEEKHVVLSIGRTLAERLQRETGAAVELTRDKDVFLSLAERVAVAERYKADMFVSVHADSAPSPTARGVSVYTLSRVASDGLADALATRENMPDVVRGISLAKYDGKVASMLVDLARRQTLHESRRVQHRLIAGLGGKTQLLDNPARSANFAVLRSPTVPAVLVETGFLSNREEEARLRTANYQRRMADLLARSLADSLAAKVAAF